MPRYDTIQGYKQIEHVQLTGFLDEFRSAIKDEIEEIKRLVSLVFC